MDNTSRKLLFKKPIFDEYTSYKPYQSQSLIRSKVLSPVSRILELAHSRNMIVSRVDQRKPEKIFQYQKIHPRIQQTPLIDLNCFHHRHSDMFDNNLQRDYRPITHNSGKITSKKYTATFGSG